MLTKKIIIINIRHNWVDNFLHRINMVRGQIMKESIILGIIGWGTLLTFLVILF